MSVIALIVEAAVVFMPGASPKGIGVCELVWLVDGLTMEILRELRIVEVTLLDSQTQILNLLLLEE